MRKTTFSILLASPLVLTPSLTISCVQTSSSYEDLNNKLKEVKLALKQKSNVDINKIGEFLEKKTPDGTELVISDIKVNEKAKKINLKFRLRYQDKTLKYSSDESEIELEYDSIRNSQKQNESENEKRLQYSATSNYYSSLNGLSATALKNKLFEIQKSHLQTWNYQGLFNIYRDAFVDKYYEKDGSVLDIYGENPSGKDPFNFWHGKYRDVGKSEGSGMNREHLVPQSWFSKLAPMRNDAHHVWPTDKIVNAAHGNLPYGTVKKATYVSKNGTKVGFSEEDGREVCEVIDEFKGDVARAYLYFALTYKNETLTANDVAKRFFNPDNSIKKAFLETMLKWHREDPVSQFDIDRNNAIEKHQGIRNPFIDYPQLVEAIYGSNSSYVFENKGILVNKA